MFKLDFGLAGTEASAEYPLLGLADKLFLI